MSVKRLCPSVKVRGGDSRGQRALSSQLPLRSLTEMHPFSPPVWVLPYKLSGHPNTRGPFTAQQDSLGLPLSLSSDRPIPYPRPRSVSLFPETAHSGLCPWSLLRHVVIIPRAIPTSGTFTTRAPSLRGHAAPPCSDGLGQLRPAGLSFRVTWTARPRWPSRPFTRACGPSGGARRVNPP